MLTLTTAEKPAIPLRICNLLQAT